MKWIKRILVVVVVLLILVFVAVTLFLGPIVKGSVERVGPSVTGVPVTLEGARISIFTGKADLKQLVVGNPEGFRTSSAFELGSFTVDLDMSTLTDDKLVINEIIIDGPQVTLEQGLRGNNLTALQKQVQSRAGQKPSAAAEEPEAAAEKKPAKQVQIDRFVFRNGKIRFSSPILQGKALTVPLPPIEMTDIGKDEGGASVSDVTTEILNRIYAAAIDAIKSSGALAGKGVELAGGAAKLGAQVAGDAAKLGTKVAGDAAAMGTKVAGDAAAMGTKVAGDAAAKGAEVAGDAAAKGAEVAGDAAAKGIEVAGGAAKGASDAVGVGARKTTEAVSGGAKKLVGGLGGLLGKKKDDAPEAVDAPPLPENK